MNTTISVVIVTRNRPEELGRCLDRVLCQSTPPLEIIVVDSSDTSEAAGVAVQYAARGDVPLRVLRTTPGVAAQRKAGVENARGEVVLYLDDDVLVEPDFICEINRVFQLYGDRGIGGVTGHDVSIRRPFPLSFSSVARTIFLLSKLGNGRFRLSGLHTSANGLRGIRPVEFLGGAFTAYRAEVLRQLPPDGERFPTTAFDDVDLSYRVSRAYQNYYTEYARCRHVPSPKNRPNPDKYRRDMEEAYARHYEKNIPPTIVHRWAYALASAGLRWDLHRLTGKDFAARALRRLLGAGAYTRLRVLHRFLCGQRVIERITDGNSPPRNCKR